MVEKIFGDMIRLVYHMDAKLDRLLRCINGTEESVAATLAKYPPHPDLPPASAVSTRDQIAQQRDAKILVDPGFGIDDTGAEHSLSPDGEPTPESDAKLVDTCRTLDRNAPEERTAKAAADADRRIYLKKELARRKVPFTSATRSVTLEKLLAEALAVEMPAPSEVVPEIPRRITGAVKKFEGLGASQAKDELPLDDNDNKILPGAPATEPPAAEVDPFGADTPVIPPATIDEARVLLTHVSAKFTKDKAFEILHKFGEKLLDLQSDTLAELAQECRKELA